MVMVKWLNGEKLALSIGGLGCIAVGWWINSVVPHTLGIAIIFSILGMGLLLNVLPARK